MTLEPPFPLPVTLTLLAAGGAAAIFLAHRGLAGASKRKRAAILALRTAAVAAIAVLVLDPGRDEPLSIPRPSRWVVLTDASSSMAVRDAEGGPTRRAVAVSLAEKFRRHASSNDIGAVFFDFDKTVRPLAGEKPVELAEGEGTDPMRAADEAIARAEAAGPVSGILMLTDARATTPTAPDAAVARALAHGAPVDTVLLGGERLGRNLALLPASRNLSAFPGSKVRVDFVIENRGVPTSGIPVKLMDADGVTLGETVVDSATDGRARGAITVPAPKASALLRLEIPVRPGESTASDNSRSVLVRALPGRCRTLVVEGAPSWDTKFLAQFLRGQPDYETHTLSRIADDRIFAVDTEIPGAVTAAPVTATKFPEDEVELARYDVVLLGRDVETLIDAPRCRMLERWVAERGGVLLFTRGRPFSGDALPTLERISPIAWGAGTLAESSFSPTAEGESAGLFSGVLPAAGDDLWKRLPALSQVRESAGRRPFSRWLAVTGGERAAPLLAMRRLGSGCVAVVNAEGLWRWQLAPESQHLAGVYPDFWNTWLHLVRDAAEFPSGRDLALRLSAESAAAGERIGVTVTRREEKGAAPAFVEVARAGSPAERYALTALPEDSGRTVYRASVAPKTAGVSLLRVLDAAGTPLAAEACLETLPPPSENDNLSPDPVAAATLAKATRGEVVAPDDFDAWLDRAVKPLPPLAVPGAVARRAMPFVPWLALAAILFLTTEWFVRRRSGLN